MYAKYVEVGDIQRGQSRLPPKGARLCCRPEDITACCALGFSVHHCDAQAFEKHTTRVLQTIAEWGCQMKVRWCHPRRYLGVPSSGSVFF